MRDEVGLVRHERGTVGISTRGRDTGDGQIFINLIDNHRLNHDYTVFARVTDGMSLVDRVTEYTIIDSVTIQRALPGKK
jgi:cyclophilin family peptidyl-prolyl cis-trans isomerase